MLATLKKRSFVGQDLSYVANFSFKGKHMIGSTIGHYKILEKLGEGGMGVVYKAQDSTLERLVALKFLPDRVSRGSGELDRFIQEAKAAAGLNHPNICTVHGIEETGGSNFIVMEFVDGQPLSERKGQLTLRQAIDVGVQVADGLAAAHEKGIVHRDIKPENIMTRKDGIVQIMDFGLAKLRGVSRITKEGSTVGTAGYMSPEQVQGQDADHRSDIFSLGVLLYELMTGQLPFKGVHETALMYEIVNVDPVPMSSVKPEIGPELDRIVLGCLEKEPAERTQSVKQVSVDLKRLKRESGRSTRTMPSRTAVMGRTTAEVESPGGSSAPAASSRKKSVWQALTAFFVVTTLFLMWNVWRGEDRPPLPVMRFSVELPEGRGLNYSDGRRNLAVSPDGKSVVYVPNADPLYIHSMEEGAARPLGGTEHGNDPFFSPDGQWVGFFADAMVKKVSVSGGAAEDICSVPGPSRGGYWGTDGFIYFGHISDAVARVRAEGGAPEMLVPLDSASGETSQRFPSLLPGNKVLLFTSKASTISTFDEAVIVAYRLDKRERKVIIRGGTCASYVPTGHLVYARGKSILAVPFDLDELEATGPPVQVLEGGMTNIGSGASEYAFSNSGVLAYVPGGPYAVDDNIVVMVDRQGHVEPLLDMARGYNEAALSPDGEKLTLTVLAANDDIWVYHTVRKTLARLTFGGGNHSRPLWTPDGKHVVYSSEVNGVPNVFKKVWDGSGAEERLTTSPSAQFPGSWSPDGRILAIEEDGKIWMLFDGNQRKPELFLDSHFPVWDPTFAPDGKWLAYGSAESGRSEIYVVPFPKREGKWQVSTGGGVNPIWARNGKELFYVSDNKVMVVQVTTLSSFNASTPRVLFPFPPRAFELTDITPDGKKFIMLVGREQEPVSQVLNVVVGWFEELKKNFAARQ